MQSICHYDESSERATARQHKVVEAASSTEPERALIGCTDKREVVHPIRILELIKNEVDESSVSRTRIASMLSERC